MVYTGIIDGGERFQTPESHDQFSSSHPSSQLVDTISYLGDDAPVKDAFKISSPWNMKTPEGYSVLFLDPFMFTNKFFACWQGVIDTDEFNVNLDNAQIIFYPLVDHSFVIPEWNSTGTDITFSKGNLVIYILLFGRRYMA